MKPPMQTHSIAYVLPIVCTGRGRHEAIQLTEVQYWERIDTDDPEAQPDHMRMPAAGRHWYGPLPTDHGHLPYGFDCPKCHGSDVQVKPSRWRQIVNAARVEGLSRLDVSYLD